MLKTISAALLAVSVLAAPALAASSGKTDAAPATKTMTGRATVAKTTATTPAAIKPSVRNANSKMHKHHVQHASHHRHHKKVAVGKVKSKVSYKPALSTTRRG
jgi:hypothetical protein